MSPDAPIAAGSVTKLGSDVRGRVVVCGSHGGVYAAALALASGCRAVVLNDAGVGLDGAGIGGLAWLDGFAMAAAVLDCRTAPIGNGDAALRAGLVSHANRGALALGVVPGMACAEAAALLAQADMPTGAAPPMEEARRVLHPEGAFRALVVIDSAGLVRPEDAGQIVITGSHGAVFGNDPANALRVAAHLAAFNDAGGGVGTGRLAVLQARGIAAVTVAAMSARIGDGHSTWQNGTVSALNDAAGALGARVGMPLRDLVADALRR